MEVRTMTNAKRKSLVSILVFSLLLPAIFAIAPQTAFGITLLHEFAGGADDGALPHGSLILSGSTLYGMTSGGGDNGYGVVFRINTNGTGHTLLHEFAGGTDDGRKPLGSLILSGSTLYGMTSTGGDDNNGVVFKMNTDGSGYGHLHEFAGYHGGDGAHPYGSLTLSGSTLYGMTKRGGDHDCGVVFKVDTDGGGYDRLHEFAGRGDAGRYPLGSLILSGSTLYGMTLGDGDDEFGAVFKINTDGNGYDLLHVWDWWGASDYGVEPRGSLILSGSTLYGMTSGGGDDNHGVVFKVNPDGSGFGLVHEFAGGADDGRNPYGSLTFCGVSPSTPSTFYGMTSGGGDNDYGVVFEGNSVGTPTFGLLHEFAGGADDGANPWGSLVLYKSASDITLYGMTQEGGDYNNGVVFALTIPEPGTILLLVPGLLGIAGFALRRGKR